jgi:hypothetical protein
MSDEETFEKLKKDLGVDEDNLPTVETHKLVGRIGIGTKSTLERQRENRAKKRKRKKKSKRVNPSQGNESGNEQDWTDYSIAISVKINEVRQARRTGWMKHEHDHQYDHQYDHHHHGRDRDRHENDGKELDELKRIEEDLDEIVTLLKPRLSFIKIAFGGNMAQGPVKLTVGQKTTASVLGFDQNGAPFAIDFNANPVAWTDDNETSVQDSTPTAPTDVLTALAAGVANIGATCGGFTDTEQATVSAVVPVLSSIKIDFSTPQ